MIAVKPPLDPDHGATAPFPADYARLDEKMPEPSVIELQVEKVGQLFDTLDPMPFRERDLDRAAEDYIVGWARELPRRAPVRILIHLPAQEASSDQAAMLSQAVSRHFRYRAEVLRRDIAELFRVGRYAMFIGLVMLVACVSIGSLAARSLLVGQLGTMIEEGLIILGWVANWRPIEIFLYDWWPIARHRNLLLRLSAAEVAISER